MVHPNNMVNRAWKGRWKCSSERSKTSYPRCSGSNSVKLSSLHRKCLEWSERKEEWISTNDLIQLQFTCQWFKCKILDASQCMASSIFYIDAHLFFNIIKYKQWDKYKSPCILEGPLKIFYSIPVFLWSFSVQEYYQNKTQFWNE